MTNIQKALTIFLLFHSLCSMKNKPAVSNTSKLPQNKERQSTFIKVDTQRESRLARESMIEPLIHRKTTFKDTFNNGVKPKNKKQEKPAGEETPVGKLVKKYDFLLTNRKLEGVYKLSKAKKIFEELMESVKSIALSKQINNEKAEQLNTVILQWWTLAKGGVKDKKQIKGQMENRYVYQKQIVDTTISVLENFIQTNAQDESLTVINSSLTSAVEFFKTLQALKTEKGKVYETLGFDKNTGDKYNFAKIRKENQEKRMGGPTTALKKLYDDLKKRVGVVAKGSGFLVLIPKSHIEKPILELYQKMNVYLVKQVKDASMLNLLDKLERTTDIFVTKSSKEEIKHTIMVKTWYLFNKTVHKYMINLLEKLMEKTADKVGHLKAINIAAEELLDEIEDLELFNDGWHDLIYLWEREIIQDERIIDRSKYSKSLQSKVSRSQKRPNPVKRRFKLARRFPRSAFLRKAFDFNSKVNKIVGKLERQNKFKNLVNQLKNSVVKMYKSQPAMVFDNEKDKVMKYPKSAIDDIRDVAAQIKKQLKRVRRDFQEEEDLQELEKNLNDLIASFGEEPLQDIVEEPLEESEEDELDQNDFIDIELKKLDEGIKTEVDPITDIDVVLTFDKLEEEVDANNNTLLDQTFTKMPINQLDTTTAEDEMLKLGLDFGTNFEDPEINYDQKTRNIKTKKNKKAPGYEDESEEEFQDLDETGNGYANEIKNILTEIELLDLEEADEGLQMHLQNIVAMTTPYIEEDFADEFNLDEFNQNLKDFLEGIRDVLGKYKIGESEVEQEDYSSIAQLLQQIIDQDTGEHDDESLNNLKSSFDDLLMFFQEIAQNTNQTNIDQIKGILEKIDILQLDEVEEGLEGALHRLVGGIRSYIEDATPEEVELNEFHLNLNQLLSTVKDLLAKFKGTDFQPDEEDLKKIDVALINVMNDLPADSQNPNYEGLKNMFDELVGLLDQNQTPLDQKDLEIEHQNSRTSVEMNSPKLFHMKGKNNKEKKKKVMNQSFTDSELDEINETDSQTIENIQVTLQRIQQINVDEQDNEFSKLLMNVANSITNYLQDPSAKEADLKNFNTNLKDVVEGIEDALTIIASQDEVDQEALSGINKKIQNCLEDLDSVNGINSAYLNQLRMDLEALKENVSQLIDVDEDFYEDTPVKRVIVVIEFVNCSECVNYLDLVTFKNLVIKNQE